MNFNDWYAANVAPTLPPGMPQIAKDAARQAMAACWNAALDAAKLKLIRCCCGHDTVKDHHDFGKCTIDGCDCMNACNCWQVVMDSREDGAPQAVDELFLEIRP